jgi:hypothetical protein
VPFTTPMLAGARARPSERAGIELVVPNPSGARGVYILHWPGVRALCRPTVHDTMLFRRLSDHPTVDPAAVRAAAHDVALQGHAGRAALAAAETAMSYDGSQRALALFLLLTGLVTRLDPDGQTVGSSPVGSSPIGSSPIGSSPIGSSPIGSSTELMPDLEKRASTVLQWIASPLGRAAAQLANDLVAIADLVAPVGVAAGDRDARIPRLLTRLDETHADLSRWLDVDPANDIGGLGRTIAVAMRLACDSGEAVLAMTRSALSDPAAVLKRWVTDEAGVQALATRCDWLLDGWERLALLWLSADPRTSRRAVLLEMAPLIPVLPREVMAWTGTPLPAETTEQTCRVTSCEDAWRTGGAAFGLIERNERLLAMST